VGEGSGDGFGGGGIFGGLRSKKVGGWGAWVGVGLEVVVIFPVVFIFAFIVPIFIVIIPVLVFIVPAFVEAFIIFIMEIEACFIYVVDVVVGLGGGCGGGGVEVVERGVFGVLIWEGFRAGTGAGRVVGFFGGTGVFVGSGGGGGVWPCRSCGFVRHCPCWRCGFVGVEGGVEVAVLVGGVLRRCSAGCVPGACGRGGGTLGGAGLEAGGVGGAEDADGRAAADCFIARCAHDVAEAGEGGVAVKGCAEGGLVLEVSGDFGAAGPLEEVGVVEASALGGGDGLLAE
jgi:hypothetical protein